VNVATAGNQVSFLVPAARVRALIERAAPEVAAPDGRTAELRRQLLAYQEAYVHDIMEEDGAFVQLGSFRAPTRPAPYFNCWGDSSHDEEDLYEAVVHTCFTEDRVFVSEEYDFSLVRFTHRRLSSEDLGPARFYTLYSEFFENNQSYLGGRPESFSPFRCRTSFVESRGITFKASFCARRYRDLPGLYDAVFKAAALGRPAEGFETALVLSALTFENAERLARRYLEQISLAPEPAPAGEQGEAAPEEGSP
jgi:hypothetical protein